MSTKLVTLELSRPLPPEIEQAANYERIWITVLRYGIPVGQVIIDNCCTPVIAAQIRSEIVGQLSHTLLDQVDYRESENFARVVGKQPKILPEFAIEPELADLLPALKPRLGQAFFLSIVVCTYDRPEDLRRCLSSLTQLEPGRHSLELIVVDNHPASGQTKPVVREFPGIRYETEPRSGVAYARNKGLKVAQGDIVGYIDDDVVAPPHWPARILAPFTDERVMCVSGLVLPLELEYRSQELFEKYGALGRGYQPRLFDQNFFNRSKRYVVHTWDLGGTANVAIRKKVIPQTGMFDETLGPGLPTGVGEDIYMFYRLLKFGHICYYEPAAYVWHKHRQDMASLQRQLYNYSKGQTSYQLRTFISDGDKRAIWQLLFDLPMWHLVRIVRMLRGSYRYSWRLIWQEVKGNIVGFYAFYRAINLHRRLNGPNANPIQSNSHLFEKGA